LAYVDSVKQIFSIKFGAAGTRMQGGSRLLSRFEDAATTVLIRGRAFINAVEESHNELCIAALCLEAESGSTIVEYEPRLRGSMKTIDFTVTAKGRPKHFVDVKTIRPAPRDRTDAYVRAVQEGHLPENTRVELMKLVCDPGGDEESDIKTRPDGEAWHDLVTARGRMLEYALELERKIQDARIAEDGSLVILALCSNGFRWGLDQLEDFASFYHTGRHRFDDPLSKMEAHFIREQKVDISRTISQFAYLSRSLFDLRQAEFVMPVRPPSA